MRGFHNAAAHTRLLQFVDELWQNARVVPFRKPNERFLTGVHVLVIHSARERLSNLRGVLITKNSKAESGPIPNIGISISHQCEERLDAQRLVRKHPNAQATVNLTSSLGCEWKAAISGTARGSSM